MNRATYLVFAALALASCALNSPDTRFTLAAGCFQLPAHAASEAGAQPRELLPRTAVERK